MVAARQIAQAVIITSIVVIACVVFVTVLMPHMKTVKYVLFGAKTEDIPADRKSELQDLAVLLHDRIYSLVLSAHWVLDDVNALSDKELAYFNEYYNQNVTENNLAYDVDWEFLPDTDEDDKLLKRIKDLGLPGKTGWVDPDNTFSKSKPLGVVIGCGLGLALVLVILTRGKAITAAAKAA